MSFWSLFTGSTAGQSHNEIPEIYPLALKCPDFVKADVLATYVKILTATAERTHGLKTEQERLLWDSCVQSASSQGLIRMLACAMYARDDLYLVYSPSVGVLRKADEKEREVIRADYAKQAKSNAGVFISFKDYDKTDLLKVWSEIEYCVVRGLYKSVNVSNAVQLKISEFRSSVGMADAEIAVAQAKAIATALRSGKDVALDAEDSVDTTTPDVEPTRKAIEFLDAKRAFHLGLPLAWISGVQTGGIGSTGDADARAIDRGLKPYFESIIKPALDELFSVSVSFIPEDTRQLTAGVELLKAFELVSDTYLSAETKRLLTARAFDLDPKAEQQRLEREARERGTTTTLNGAQSAAMGAFLEQLAAGTLAPETAVAALVVSFAMSEEDARKIVEPMRRFRATTAPQQQLPPGA